MLTSREKKNECLTIVTDFTGMCSWEVPAFGSFQSGNLMTSLPHEGFFGYGFSGEEGGNLQLEKILKASQLHPIPYLPMQNCSKPSHAKIKQMS